jgi:hypothetical protein
MLEMHLCSVELLAAEADHSSHPSGIRQVACFFQSGQCRVLITVIQRADAINESPLICWCHQPLEKTQLQPVAMRHAWRGGCPIPPGTLAIMDCIEKPGPG